METIGNRWAVLSGSWLKVLAMLTMLIDHLGAFYFICNPQFFQPLITIGHHHVTLYFLIRLVGRMAFPIFAFLIVEGFLHTRDRVKYGRNLLLFAFLSEVPWNLVHSGTWHYGSQNVMFTLFLGFLGLCAIEYYRKTCADRSLPFFRYWSCRCCYVPTMAAAATASSLCFTPCATDPCYRPSWARVCWVDDGW